jgi:3-oxoacyl-(acyl-carrier-protein) synthase III
VADNMLKGGMAEYALVIGAETFSRLLDWEDRTTCVLFGDGAGALLLQSVEAQDRGILATKLHADGRHNGLLFVDGGASTTGTIGKLRMRGKEVFRHAVVNLASVLTETLEAAGHTAQEVDWVVPHQANKRILDATAKKLGLDPARVVITVDQHANTSAASVPLALDTAVRDGRIKKAISSCSKQWAAASPGAPRSPATESRSVAMAVCTYRQAGLWFYIIFSGGGERHGRRGNIEAHGSGDAHARRSGGHDPS